MIFPFHVVKSSLSSAENHFNGLKYLNRANLDIAEKSKHE